MKFIIIALLFLGVIISSLLGYDYVGLGFFVALVLFTALIAVVAIYQDWKELNK